MPNRTNHGTDMRGEIIDAVGTAALKVTPPVTVATAVASGFTLDKAVLVLTAKAVYTEQECAEKLNSRLGSYLTDISQCIKVPLREREWAAVLSWTYNVGVGAACRSTLVGRINAGQPAVSWCPELDRWVYAGGKRVQGLVNRRAAERRMCEGRS